MSKQLSDVVVPNQEFHHNSKGQIVGRQLKGDFRGNIIIKYTNYKVI